MNKTSTNYLPVILQCSDPENCGLDHNEIDHWETDIDQRHHYGCECQDCMLFYYLKLK